MSNFGSLSDELALALLQPCEIETWVAVGLTSKRFSCWFNERIFWICALKSTKRLRPIACPFYEDLSTRSLSELKDIGLRTLRLERNWSLPQPRMAGPLRSINLRSGLKGSVGAGVGGPPNDPTITLDVIFQVPGTMLYLLHSRDDSMLRCFDMRLGRQVSATGLYAAPYVVDVSPGQEDPGSYSMGLLLSADIGQTALSMAIVKIEYSNEDEEVGLSFTFETDLDSDRDHWAIFMSREVVGVITQPRALGETVSTVDILAFNIVSKAQTLIETDFDYQGELSRIGTQHSGSSISSGDLFFLAEDAESSFVYCCPRSLLPTDDQLTYPKNVIFKGSKRNHTTIDWLVDSPDSESRQSSILGSYMEGALSADSYYGVPSTSLHRHVMARESDSGNEQELHPLPEDPLRNGIEIRFWTCQEENSLAEEGQGVGEVGHAISGAGSQVYRTLAPSSSSFIPGIVHETAGSAWRLLLIPHSGRVVVMVLDVGRDHEPALTLVRFHTERKESTVHTLELPDEVSLSSISGIAVDDYRGLVSLLDSAQGVMYLVPYA